MSERLSVTTASWVPRLSWPGEDDPRIVFSDDDGCPYRCHRDTLPIPRLVESDRIGGGGDLLIHGENWLAHEALLASGQAGTVDLAYLDPPFNTGRRFEHYPDQMALGSYLSMLRDRLRQLHQLLSARGTLVVHIDEAVSHLVRLLLDEVFGPENYRNAVIVKRVTKNLQRQFREIACLPQAHDVCLIYSRDPSRRYPLPVVPKPDGPRHPAGYWKDFWSTADRPTMRYELLGVTPARGQWKWRRERAEAAVANHETYLATGAGPLLVDWWEQQGREPEFIRRNERGRVQHWVPPSATKLADTVWDSFSGYAFRQGFPTEKSEALLRQVLEFYSAPGDLVLDSFAGSGTTAAAAIALGRRWILIERGAQALTHIRPRLLEAGAEFRVCVIEDAPARVAGRKRRS